MKRAEVLGALALAVTIAAGALLAVHRLLASRTIVRGPPQALMDIMTIEAAIEAYRKDHGDWPKTLAALVVPDKNGWTYITLPLDPWKRPYRYDPPTDTEARARVYTLGRDGLPGGTGDDADIDSGSVSAPR